MFFFSSERLQRPNILAKRNATTKRTVWEQKLMGSRLVNHQFALIMGDYHMPAYHTGQKSS